MAHVHSHEGITVSKEGAEGLMHKFKISVTAAAIEEHVEEYLKEYGKKAKIPGFRPGKVPMQVLQQKFRPNVMGEVLEHMADAGVRKAMNDNDLKPAMQPNIKIEKYEDGGDLLLNVEVEVLPPLPKIDFSKIKLEKPMSKPSDAKVDEAIQELAQSMAKAEALPEGTAAKMDNVVTIDFAGTVDGVARDGMAGEDMNVQLGKRQLIDTFEDQMVGMKVGDEKLIKVTFPENYHAKDLAGKAAEFKVTMKKVSELKAPAVNEALAKQLSLESVAQLREKITERLQADLDSGSRLVLKRRLLDHLAEAYPFDLPKSMLDAEFNSIWRRVEAELVDGKDEDGKTADQLKPEYEKIAARRVRLGLLLADLAEKENIQVSEDAMRQALFAEIQRYPQHGQQVLEYYTKTPGAMDNIRAPLLEEKAVDFVFEKSTISEKQVTLAELEKMVEELTA